MRISRVTCVALVVLAATGVHAFINPSFTPSDLVKQAEAIVAGRLESTGEAVWQVMDATTIKGEAGDGPTVNLAKSPKGVQQAFRAAVDGSPETVIFIASRKQRRGASYCFVGTSWFVIEAADDAWHVTGTNDNMAGTYFGDAASLRRMVGHLHDNPDASIRTSVGTSWYETVMLTQAGEPRHVTLIRLEYDGKARPHVYVSAGQGDRLLAISGKKKFADVTSDRGLDPADASRLAVVIDANEDGADDLVRWDGQAIRLQLQQDGRFAPNGDVIDESDDVRSLHPLRVNGQAALVVAGTSGVRLLTQSDGQWMVSLISDESDGGPADTGPLVVADFDNDGLPDILRARREAGQFWRGSANGFNAARPAAVVAEGDATLSVADFNNDGLLDVYASSANANALWQNTGEGSFRNAIDGAGWLAKKATPGALVTATDLNHDGWEDLAIFPAGQRFQYHFNRGFGTFAEEGELGLTGVPGDSPVVAAVTADFNGDGSEDLVVALADGRVFCLFNDLYDLPAVRVRLSASVAASPRTIVIGDGDTARAYRVDAAGPGAHVSVTPATDQPLIVRITAAAGQASEQSIEVDPLNTIDAVVPEP